MHYLLINKVKNLFNSFLKKDTKEFKDKESETLSKEEHFTLNIGALEHKRITESLKEYNLLKYLEEEWGINGKEEESKTLITYQLQQLWSKGTLSTFVENRFLKKELKVKDLIAFDAARFTELLCQLLYLKLIDEEEAWGLLFLNAQRVQESFKNAEDFSSSYFKGALFYEITFKTEEKERGKKIDKFDTIFTELKENNNVTIEWLKSPLFNQFKINEMEN